MSSEQKTTPGWAAAGPPEAPLRRSYTEHMAAMEAAGWPPAPRWDELSDAQRDLWRAVEELRAEDIDAVCRKVLPNA